MVVSLTVRKILQFSVVQNLAQIGAMDVERVWTASVFVWILLKERLVRKVAPFTSMAVLM
jgi:hypothetical protein